MNRTSDLDKKVCFGRFIVFSLLLPFLLLGCSSNDTEGAAPSPVPEFESTINIGEIWSQFVGNGNGGEYLALEPGVTKRSIYAGSLDGELLKIDSEEGEIVWEQETDFNITGGMAVGFGVIAFGTQDGELVVARTADGHVVWTAQLGAEVLAVPAITEHKVIVQTMDGHLYGYDRNTGERKWTYDTPIPMLTLRGSSSPLIVGEFVIAGFANGKLVALDYETGLPIWERLVAQPTGRSELERLVDVDGTLWSDGKVVYAASYQGKIVAIDINSGTMLWSHSLSSYSGVAGAGDKVFATDAEGNVLAFDALSGEEVWRQTRLTGRKLTAPVASGKYLVVGDIEGYLYWLDVADGKFADSTTGGSGFRSKAVVMGSVVYIQSNDGEISALSRAY